MIPVEVIDLAFKVLSKSTIHLINHIPDIVNFISTHKDTISEGKKRVMTKIQNSASYQRIADKINGKLRVFGSGVTK